MVDSRAAVRKESTLNEHFEKRIHFFRRFLFSLKTFESISVEMEYVATLLFLAEYMNVEFELRHQEPTPARFGKGKESIPIVQVHVEFVGNLKKVERGEMMADVAFGLVNHEQFVQFNAGYFINDDVLQHNLTAGVPFVLVRSVQLVHRKEIDTSHDNVGFTT